MMNPALFSEIDNKPKMPGPPQRDDDQPRRDSPRYGREREGSRREPSSRNREEQRSPGNDRSRPRYRDDDRRRPVSEGIRYSRPKRNFGRDESSSGKSHSRHER